jgi:hypothetical protein
MSLARSGGARGEVDVRAHAAACGHVAANVAISGYILERLGLPRSRIIYKQGLKGRLRGCPLRGQVTTG